MGQKKRQRTSKYHLKKLDKLVLGVADEHWREHLGRKASLEPPKKPGWFFKLLANLFSFFRKEKKYGWMGQKNRLRM